MATDDEAMSFDQVVAGFGESLVLSAVVAAIDWVNANSQLVDTLGEAVPANRLYFEHLLPINEMGNGQMQLPEGFRMVVTAVWKQLIAYGWSDDLMVGAGWVMLALDELLGQLMPDLEMPSA